MRISRIISPDSACIARAPGSGCLPDWRRTVRGGAASRQRLCGPRRPHRLGELPARPAGRCPDALRCRLRRDDSGNSACSGCVRVGHTHQHSRAVGRYRGDCPVCRAGAIGGGFVSVQYRGTGGCPRRRCGADDIGRGPGPRPSQCCGICSGLEVSPVE